MNTSDFNELPWADVQEQMPDTVQHTVQRTLNTLPDRTPKTARLRTVAITCIAIGLLMFVTPLGAMAIQGIQALFGFFTTENSSVNYVMEQTGKFDAQKVSISLDDNSEAQIYIRSAYYDGESLYVLYEIDGGCQVIQPYMPTESEKARLAPMDTLPLPETETIGSKEQEILNAFYHAFYNGGAAGFYCREITLAQPIFASSGAEISYVLARQANNGADALGYIQFAVPLPDDLRKQADATLSLVFYVSETWYWVEDGSLYKRVGILDEKAIILTIPRSKTVERIMMVGQAEEQVPIAEVTPLTIQVHSTGAELSQTLSESFEYMLWNPVAEKWEQSTMSWPNEDGGRTQVFTGFGQIPDEIYVCPQEVIMNRNGMLIAFDTVPTRIDSSIILRAE